MKVLNYCTINWNSLYDDEHIFLGNYVLENEILLKKESKMESNKQHDREEAAVVIQKRKFLYFIHSK